MALRTNTASVRVERFDDVPEYRRAFEFLTEFYEQKRNADDVIDFTYDADEETHESSPNGHLVENEDGAMKDVGDDAIDLAAGLPGK